MLSKKFKAQLKNAATSTVLAVSTVAVLFGMGANLDSIVNTIKDIARANASEIKAESEAILEKDHTGYSIDITAKDDSGVRKIEVYQGSSKIEEKNFGGSDEVEYANVHLNTIPFGSKETITVKVNGETIDTKEITNTRYISTAQDLEVFRDSVNTGNNYAGQIVELINDIDLSSVCYKVDGTVANDVSWTPIGPNNTISFAGTFVGNYHKIENLYINTRQGQFISLFGYNNGTICKLISVNPVVTANITAGFMAYAGGIVGYNNNLVRQCGVKSIDNKAKIYIYDDVRTGAGGDLITKVKLLSS